MQGKTKRKTKTIKVSAIDFTRAMGIDVLVFTGGSLKPKKLKGKKKK